MATKSLLIAVLSVLLLAGCGGGGSAAPASSSAAPPRASAAASSPSSTAAAASPSAAASAKPASAPASSAKPAASARASGSAAPSIAPAAPGTIIVSYSELTAINLPLWYSVETGLFKKHGLSVDARLIESSLGVGALLSDEVKFAAMGGSESLAADVGGADLLVLGTLSPVYPYKLEVKDSIKNAQDLKGKTIGISRIGSSSDSATRAALRKLGLNPDTDVKIIQVGSLAARMAALFSGKLDGAVAALPDTIKLEQQGFHPLIDEAAAKLPAVNNTLVARREYVEANKDVTQKYMDTMVDGIVQARKDKPEALKVMKKYLKERSGDENALEQTYDFYVNQVFRVPPISTPDLFADSVEQLSKKEPKAKTFDIKAIIDNSFAEKAAKDVKGAA